MLMFRASLGLLISALVAAPSAVASPAHKIPPHAHSHLSAASRSKKGRAPRGRKLRGQQVIDSGRVTEIQQALVREHYLSGGANGHWDATTEEAMQKYQSDQGWQTKLMPDSRALKKLGLGADYSTAINAKTASFADPPSISTIPAPQAAGFAAASGTDHATGPVNKTN